jgi:hypothetical protein
MENGKPYCYIDWEAAIKLREKALDKNRYDNYLYTSKNLVELYFLEEVSPDVIKNNDKNKYLLIDPSANEQEMTMIRGIVALQYNIQGKYLIRRL